MKPLQLPSIKSSLAGIGGYTGIGIGGGGTNATGGGGGGLGRGGDGGDNTMGGGGGHGGATGVYDHAYGSAAHLRVVRLLS